MLTIPSIPALDSTALPEVASLLGASGARLDVATVNWPDEYPYAPSVHVTAGHTDSTLYVDYAVKCDCLRAVTAEDNGPVHQDSCVEFFIGSKPGLRTPYINFELNCIGTLSAALRRGRSEDVQPLAPEALARVRRHSTCGTKPFDEMEGTFEWHLTVAIPLDLIGIDTAAPQWPVTMYGNLYKCADLTANPHFLSWAPIGTEHPDFHRPEYFQPIVLA